MYFKKVKLMNKSKTISNISLTILLSIFSVLQYSCEKEPPVVNEPEPNPNTGYVVPTIIPTGSEHYLNENADYVFNQTQFRTFELNLPEASLAQIDADPTAEEYVEGSLTFEGETISPVGIRYKGSVGAFVNCVSGNDWANPSGYKTCTKLSMKIKINWNGSDTQFFGMKKLQFHSQNNDPTQMHERLGYWLFRSMGVPAPRAVHCRLVINGQFIGVFILAEQIDGRFTKKNFADGDGNLYKEIWPIDDQGNAFSEAKYLSHLKTNTDQSPTAAIIRAFGTEIQNSTPSTIQTVIENRMDVNEILSYAVVDRLIRNDDGAFHWYCFNDCSSHNFYWYEEPNSGQMHLIPWDLDHAFDNIQSGGNPVTTIADDWGQTRNNCEPFSYGFLGIQQKSAACDKLTKGWTTYTTEYDALKTQFKNTYFSEAQVNALINLWTAQIRDATIEAAEKHNDALALSEWENAVASLRTKLKYSLDNY